MSRCKLIVNADDFGLSEKVNEGIVNAHIEGIVTATSVMVNGTAFEHALQLSQSVPSLDIGLHLTLTEETPILETATIPSLVNKEHKFHDHANTLTKRLLLGQISLEDIRRELDAQIRKAKDYSMTISHLDGHQHIHMLPGIRRIVGDLAEQYAIPSIRYPMEPLRPYMLRATQGLGRLIQLVALNSFCLTARTAYAKRPDTFAGFFFGGNLTEENLITVLKNLPASGVCEIMCHPGLEDQGSRYKHWAYSWQNELDALTSATVKLFLQERGITLIPYSALAD